MAFQFECFQSGCSFLVRADSREAVVRLVTFHADEAHDLSLEDDAIESERERT